MSSADDRPWRAEETPKPIIEKSPGDRATAREDPERVDPPVSDKTTTLSNLPDVSASGGSPANAKQALPAAPPVSVPNHELIRCLGAGGFGQVWLAKHTLTEHHRACKLIPADKALELDGLRRLKQRVPPHDNLFPIEDVGAVGNWLYCLMPLAQPASADHAGLDDSLYEPLTLKAHLARHDRRPTAEAASIGLELARAVQHLHKHGVTHGDIKPANIMRHNGRWTLADYGLARELSAPSGQGYTPGYTPPEGPGSTKADQFALGIVLMEMLANWPARMLAEFRETSIKAMKLDSRGPRMAQIIRRATAEDPHERFGSMDELIAALRPLATRRMPTRRVAGALVVVAAAVIVGTASLLRTTPKSPAASTSTAAAADAPLVESFEVVRYEYDPQRDETKPIGPLDADNYSAREYDDVTVHARFSAPAYFYLVSLDADGQVSLRLPDSLDKKPAAAGRIDYPSHPDEADGDLFRLEEGPGTQGFMLLASRDPLPPWTNWVAARGAPTWTSEALPDDCVILFDGHDVRYLNQTRGVRPRRGELVRTPIDWCRAQEDLSGVRFIAFPVLPREEH